MSNNVSVFSAITGQKVAEFDTASETLESVKAKAMAFREVATSSVGTQLALIAIARNVFNDVATSQAIRDAALTAVHIDRVEVHPVAVEAPAVEAPEAETEAETEEAPHGTDVSIYSAVTGNLVDSFNTEELTYGEVVSEALSYAEIEDADLATRVALEELLQGVYSATESKVLSNETLAKVGISRVVIAVDGIEPEDADDTPIYSETVKAAAAEAEAPKALSLVKAEPEAPRYVDTPLKDVVTVKTVTVRRGLPAWGTAVIGAVAAVVGAVIGGGIF